MKGRVGLVGWPVADSLPTTVVTHQLQVECGTGEVHRPETDVLPLCYTANLSAQYYPTTNPKANINFDPTLLTLTDPRSLTLNPGLSLFF